MTPAYFASILRGGGGARWLPAIGAPSQLATLPAGRSASIQRCSPARAIV
jgi:hypothetical protein